jgi:hypothetical protein
MFIPDDILLAAIASFLLGMAGGYPCCCPEGDGTSTSSTSTSSTSSTPGGSTAPIGTVPCTFCQPDTLSEYYQIEFDGIVNGTDCTDCDRMNGVYILGPMQGGLNDCTDVIATATVCDADPDPDCFEQLTLQFFRFGGDYLALVDWQTGATACGTGGGQPKIEWEQNYGTSPPNCLFNGEDIPFSNHGVGTVRCDASGSTCTVTAIPPP